MLGITCQHLQKILSVGLSLICLEDLYISCLIQAFLTTRTTPLKTHNEDMIEAQKVLVLASETKNTLEGVNQIFLKSISMFGDNQTNFSAEESMERF